MAGPPPEKDLLRGCEPSSWGKPWWEVQLLLAMAAVGKSVLGKMLRIGVVCASARREAASVGFLVDDVEIRLWSEGQGED